MLFEQLICTTFFNCSLLVGGSTGIRPSQLAWNATANGRQGCIIWADFVKTKFASPYATGYFFTASNQFPSKRNRFQTWSNAAASH